MEMTETIKNEHKLKDIEKVPFLFKNKDSFFELIKNKRVVLFLDFVGTLSKIVNQPEDAIITDDMKEALRSCSEKFKTAVVSGRDMDDVKNKVSLDSVIYAGSHGFRISGPKGLKMRHPESAEILPNLNDIEKELNEILAGKIKGVRIERKMFAIAVHYRNASEEDIPFIDKKVTQLTKNNPDLKKGKGKKIFEIKPDLNWHKGKAIDWILDSINMNKKDVVPVYLGDDVTDEDGFRTLFGKGIGILVSTHGKPTAAQYRLKDVDQVKDFLEMMSNLPK